MDSSKTPQVIATVGGLVDKVSVTLALYGDALDPEYVTALVGCAPSGAHRKGEQKRPGSVPYRIGAWLLSEEGDAPLSIDDLLARLFARIPDDPRLWERLGSEFDLQLRVGLFLNEWNRGCDIAAEHIQRLATMKGRLMFDIYAEQLG